MVSLFVVVKKNDLSDRDRYKFDIRTTRFFGFCGSWYCVCSHSI